MRPIWWFFRGNPNAHLPTHGTSQGPSVIIAKWFLLEPPSLLRGAVWPGLVVGFSASSQAFSWSCCYFGGLNRYFFVFFPSTCIISKRHKIKFHVSYLSYKWKPKLPVVFEFLLFQIDIPCSFLVHSPCFFVSRRPTSSKSAIR